MATEEGKGKRKGNGKGKVLLNKPQGEMISLVPFYSSHIWKCKRQTLTWRPN